MNEANVKKSFVYDAPHTERKEQRNFVERTKYYIVLKVIDY